MQVLQGEKQEMHWYALLLLKTVETTSVEKDPEGQFSTHELVDPETYKA